jgi:curved DNA-binding protein CbpA
MEEDFYKILGVSQSASQEEIKKTYRKKAHKYHPDKEDGDEEKFKEVNKAYQVLSDEDKRQKYDRHYENDNQKQTSRNNHENGSYRGSYNGYQENKSETYKKEENNKTNKKSPFFYVGLLIAFILFTSIWGLFDKKESSSNINTNTRPENKNQVEVPVATSDGSKNEKEYKRLGKYRCSEFHYYEAVDLKPDKAEEQKLNKKEDELESKNNQIRKLRNKVDSMDVNGYSDRYKINKYNRLVDKLDKIIDNYNKKNQYYKRLSKDYNAKVKKYNNYLEKNCSKVE